MPETTLRPISDVEQGWDSSTGGGGYGTLHLAVDTLIAGTQEWTEVGISPYLHTAETANRIETASKNLQHGNFTYQDSKKTVEDITHVDLIISVYGDGNDAVHVYLHDGTTEHDLGSVTGDPDTWTDEVIDVTTILDTWAKIDAARIRIVKETSGKENLFKVCYSEVTVSWELARVDYTEVDEETADENKTMLSTGESGATQDDLFGFETFNLPEGHVINSVRVYGRAKGAEGKGYFYLLIKPTTTKYSGGGGKPASSYTTYYNEWSENPDGGSWTEDSINALSAGVRGKTEIHCVLKCTVYIPYGVNCTQCYLVVNHSLPVGLKKRMLMKLGL